MPQVDFDNLAESLINEYLSQFKAGLTWNYYNWDPKYVKGDTWVSRDEWMNIAKDCLVKNTNVLQSLEILLDEETDAYISIAEEVVEKWYNEGGYDAHYYYDIIAHLPRQNPIRQSVVSMDAYDDFFCIDSSEQSLLRTALVRVKDADFCKTLGDYLNNLLSSSNLDDELMEDKIIPLLIEFGAASESYVLPSNLERVKEFCLAFLENDKRIVNYMLNGGSLNEEERQVWVGDNIAYWAWRLGWRDILTFLKGEEWYWASIFSEWWDDSESYNLLVWSLLDNNDSVRRRAMSVMQNHELHKLDGAIAWKRLGHQ